MSLLLAAGSSGGGIDGSIVVTLSGATASLTGAEVFSGAISTTLAGASATLTGSEVYSGAVSAALTGATVALAGSQTHSGAVSSTLSGASANLTGAASSGVSGSISVTLDGAVADIDGALVQSGGGDYQKKKRFIVEKNGKLLVFSNANAAVNAIPDKPNKPVEVVEERPQEIKVSEVKKVLDVSRVDYLLTMKHLEALVAEYEAQREEQDIEELLLLI